MKIPRTTLERNLLTQGYQWVIGVDEVGMACLAGPVVVCALAVTPEFHHRRYPKLAGLRDSKLLSPSQRERFARELMEMPGLRWRIARQEPAAIDEVNIYQASRLAMREAITALGNPKKLIVLVDGNKQIPGLGVSQRAIVKGDQKIWAIAAASILAKVHRDALMAEYAVQYPGYGFEAHKGYPTQYHRERLKTLGFCAIHRRSFKMRV
jgi:ribonuclease HII